MLTADDVNFAHRHASEYARSAGAFSDESEDFADWIVRTYLDDVDDVDLSGIPPLPAALRRYEDDHAPFIVHRPLA